MPRCCGGATCSCAIEAGQHIQIAGVGSATDPFVIIGDVDLEVSDNTTFNLTLGGTGTLASPWLLSVAFAATAKLNDFPDVNVPAPTNGQVLAWNSSTSQWEAVAPTTAASGALTHDTSLSGDGSAGSPLQVQEDPAGLLTTRAPGLGLSDTGINQTVRKFATEAARTAATPAPTLNTLSLVDSNPGQIEYFNGTSWSIAGGVFRLGSIVGEEFYQLSGPYASGRLTLVTLNLMTSTDSNGVFTIFDATALAGWGGVMSIGTQQINGVGSVPYVVQAAGVGGAVLGYAYRIDDGQPLGLNTVSLSVTAFLY